MRYELTDFEWAAIKPFPPNKPRGVPRAAGRQSVSVYRARNLVERFFNKIKQYRRVATRYDRLAADYLAFIKLASIRVWLRVYESASWIARISSAATRPPLARKSA